MEERNRDILESKGAFWARVIFYNIFVVIAIFISIWKFGHNQLSGIQGMGDLAGFRSFVGIHFYDLERVSHVVL